MNTASKEEVEEFLGDLKDKLDVTNKVIFEDEDKKDMATILKLELLSENERINYVKRLTFKEYYQGPLDDTKHGGVYWVFGKQIKGKEIYIKINIGKEDYPVIIISFHISDHKMEFPLK